MTAGAVDRARLAAEPDGAQELVALDLQIEQARAAPDPEALLGALSRRANAARPARRLPRGAGTVPSVDGRGREQPARVGDADRDLDPGAPSSPRPSCAWTTFKRLARDPSEWEPPAATLDEARGNPEGARVVRERAAELHPTAANLTNLAANLAMAWPARRRDSR